MRVTSAGRSETGPYRKRNEDSFLVDDDLRLYLVADGMGGHRGGAQASAMAVSRMSHFVRNDPPMPNEMLDAYLRERLIKLNLEVYEPQAEQPHAQKMGTTLVALWLHGDKALVSNVGDSRCYRYRPELDDLKQLTSDHNLFEQVRQVEPDLSARQFEGLSSALTKVIGIHESLDPDLTLEEARAGDVFVLCTDGITKDLDSSELHEVMREHGKRSAITVAEKVMHAASMKVPKDNYTVVVVKIEESGPDETLYSSDIRSRKKHKTNPIYFWALLVAGLFAIAFLVWNSTSDEIPASKAAPMAFERGEYDKAAILYRAAIALAGSQDKFELQVGLLSSLVLSKGVTEESRSLADELIVTAESGLYTLPLDDQGRASLQGETLELVKDRCKKRWKETHEPPLLDALARIPDKQKLKYEIMIEEGQKLYVDRLKVAEAIKRVSVITTFGVEPKK